MNCVDWQKASEFMDRSAGLLLQKTFSDAENALGVIAEALVISPYSEKLLESKAEALFMVCGFLVCQCSFVFPSSQCFS